MASNVNEGYLKLPNSIIFRKDLPIESKAILAYIAAKPENWAFCSVRMADELGVSEGTVKKYRRILEKTLVDASCPDLGYLVSKQREQSGFFRYFVNFPSVKIGPDKIGPDKIGPDKIGPNKKEKNIPIKKKQIKEIGDSLKEGESMPLALKRKTKNLGSSGTSFSFSEDEMTPEQKKIRKLSYEWIRANFEKADKLLESCKREIRNGSESANYVNTRDIERMAKILRLKKLEERYIDNKS